MYIRTVKNPNLYKQIPYRGYCRVETRRQYPTGDMDMDSQYAIPRDTRMTYVNDYTVRRDKATEADAVHACLLCDAIAEAYDNFDGEIVIVSRFNAVSRYEMEMCIETKKGVCMAGMVNIETQSIEAHTTYECRGIEIELFSDMFASHKSASLTMYHSELREYAIFLQDIDGDWYNPVEWYTEYCTSQLEEDITQEEADSL